MSGNLVEMEFFYPSVEYDYTIENRRTVLSFCLSEDGWKLFKQHAVEAHEHLSPGRQAEVQNTLQVVEKLVNGCICVPLTYLEVAHIMTTLSHVEDMNGKPYISRSMGLEWIDD